MLHYLTARQEEGKAAKTIGLTETSPSGVPSFSRDCTIACAH
jgi:hypothetical protein